MAISIPGSDSPAAYYLLPGILDAQETEEMLREAVDSFFSRAGESYIRSAWEDTSGNLNWHDVLGKRHYVDMYFGAYEIERTRTPRTARYDTLVTVALDPEERLFPEYWAEKMRALDAGRRD